MLSKKDFLDKEVKRCEMPTLINEFIEIDIGTKIEIHRMRKHTNPSFSGTIFDGSPEFNGNQYSGYYRSLGLLLPGNCR